MDTINADKITLTKDKEAVPNYDEPIENKKEFNYEGLKLKEKSNTWNDIRELSAALFSIDSIIDMMHSYKGKAKVSKVDKAKIEKSISIIFGLLKPGRYKVKRPLFFYELKNSISESWNSPDKMGIETDKLNFNNDIKAFVTEAEKLVENVKEKLINKEAPITNSAKYYRVFVEECKKSFVNIDSKTNEDSRIPKLTIAAFLYSISTKLSYCKYLAKMQVTGGISTKEASEIRASIDTILKDNM